MKKTLQEQVHDLRVRKGLDPLSGKPISKGEPDGDKPTEVGSPGSGEPPSGDPVSKPQKGGKHVAR